LLLFLIPILAIAQFQDLATTDDGAQLYFSSSLRQKGTDQYTSPKILRYADGRFELFRQEKMVDLGIGNGKTNPYQLVSPDLSGDGQVVGYTGIANCSAGSGCIGFIRNTGFLVGAEVPQISLANGTLRVARDRRYALRFGGDTFAPVPRNALIDLATGTVTNLSQYSIIGDGRQSLADNGVVLLRDSESIVLWRNGGTVSTGYTISPLAARLNRSATLFIAETVTGGGAHRLAAYDLGNRRRETVLAETAAGTVSPQEPAKFRPSISSDGTLVLYLDSGQAIIQSTNGSGRRQLAQVADGVMEAVLSGNGNIAYAVTGNGTLLRIEVATGTVTQLIASTPQITQIASGSAPGSYNRVLGTGLSEADLRINGVAPPIISRTRPEIAFQIPWETPTNDNAVISASGASDFESVLNFPIQGIAPRFEDVVVHEGFDGLVTSQNPAKSGEIIHLYMTGLGAVEPPVATGQPTPTTELHPAVARTVSSCLFFVRAGNSATTRTANINFVGLAPGLIGIYQMDVRVPAGLTASDATLNCSFLGSQIFAFTTAGPFPVAP
jgi:uncharacterized protein (TIGR03437 family)